MKLENPIDFQCPLCSGDLRAAIASVEVQVSQRLQRGLTDGMEWYALSRLAEALAEVSKRASVLDYVGMPGSHHLVEHAPTSPTADSAERMTIGRLRRLLDEPQTSSPFKALKN